MKCIHCKQEMLYGRIYFDSSVAHRFVESDQQLYFSEFYSNSKPIILIPYKGHCTGFYCTNCGDVWLNNKNINKKFTTSNNGIVYGELYVKPGFTRFNYTHLDFMDGNKTSYKIFDGSSYVRGFYCEKCGISCFNIKNIVT